jgi:phage shock protein A
LSAFQSNESEETQMNYFSRLTDIVTCNLNEILARESDPVAALRRIIAEMDEGLAGARRSVSTAATNEQRLRGELGELHGQVEHLTEEARESLRAGDESAARVTLVRRQEVADVIAGLEQQHKAACATRDHLNTTLRALEARLSEARRRMQELEVSPKMRVSASTGQSLPYDDPRSRQIEDELATLKREIGLD